MPNVCSSELLTGRTFAALLDRSRVGAVRVIFEVHCTASGKGSTIAGQASWQNAVEHGNTAGDHLDDLWRGAGTPRGPWLPSRQKPPPIVGRLPPFPFLVLHAGSGCRLNIHNKDRSRTR